MGASWAVFPALMLLSMLACASSTSDADILLAFKGNFSNGHTVLADWTGADPCGGKWTGVSCAQGRVTSIDLQTKGLTGSLPQPAGWSLPDSLKKLNLGVNAITGSLPSALALPDSLEYLDLRANSIQGTISKALRLPHALTYLHLGFNNLSSTVPEGLELPGGLQYLSIAQNKLVGSLPTWLQLPSSLQSLAFDSNAFQGSIPPSWDLSALSALTWLDLSNNHLTGSIPADWRLPASLNGDKSAACLLTCTGLGLQNNSLAGSLPAWPDHATMNVFLQPGNDRICGLVPAAPLYFYYLSDPAAVVQTMDTRQAMPPLLPPCDRPILLSPLPGQEQPPDNPFSPRPPDGGVGPGGDGSGSGNSSSSSTDPLGPRPPDGSSGNSSSSSSDSVSNISDSGSGSSSGGSSTAAIVGGVVGGVAGAAALCLLAWCLLKRKRQPGVSGKEAELDVEGGKDVGAGSGKASPLEKASPLVSSGSATLAPGGVAPGESLQEPSPRLDRSDTARASSTLGSSDGTQALTPRAPSLPRQDLSSPGGQDTQGPGSPARQDTQNPRSPTRQDTQDPSSPAGQDTSASLAEQALLANDPLLASIVAKLPTHRGVSPGTAPGTASSTASDAAPGTTGATPFAGAAPWAWGGTTTPRSTTGTGTAASMAAQRSPSGPLEPLLQLPAGRSPSLSRSASSSSAKSAKQPLVDMRLWIIPFSELSLRRQIGAGSYGRVYQAYYKDTVVAAKVLLGEASKMANVNEAAEVVLALPSAMQSTLEQEGSIMAALRHPNVLSFIGLSIAPPCLVSEFCPRGSLYDTLREARGSPPLASQLTWVVRLRMALGAALGMQYLHSFTPAIVHRDLKSPNLCISHNWVVKVADFNLCKIMQQDSLGLPSSAASSSSIEVNNPRWLAPEVLTGGQHTFASDVYSYGIILWELLTLQAPFEGQANIWQVTTDITRGRRPEVPTPDQLPGGARAYPGLPAYEQLMRRCWAQEPGDRPGFGEVIGSLRKLLALAVRPLGLMARGAGAQEGSSGEDLAAPAATAATPHPPQPGTTIRVHRSVRLR